MRWFLFAQSWNVLLMHACDVIAASAPLEVLDFSLRSSWSFWSL